MPTAQRRGQRESSRSEPARPEKRAEGASPARGFFWFAKPLLIGALGVQSLVVGAVVDAIKDTARSFIPSASLISAFVRSYPGLAIAAVGITVLATLGAAVIVWRNPTAVDSSRSAARAWLRKPAVGLSSISVAAISSGGLVFLLILLMARPDWCPSQICVAGLAQYPGPQDGFLGANVFAIQSDTILIPGDPTTYSLGHLPATEGFKTVGAVLTQPVTGPIAPSNQPYRLAARVQNLRPDLGELSIETVALVVTQAKAPGHVNAWRQGAVADYEENPFLASYGGETVGQTVPALYIGPVPFGHVTLKPGESDVLTVKLWSSLPADLSYRLEITYRYLDQTKFRTFVDPQIVEVVFASRLQWSQYELRNGKLEPA